MSKFKLPQPVNETQRQFIRLCELGGGIGGGPPRTKVQELLSTDGKALNRLAFEEMQDALNDNPGANPWHVCFAMGLCWGRLAQLTKPFIADAVDYLDTGSHTALKRAEKCHYERGPDPINQSLHGGRILFDRVILPKTLPDTIRGIARAQERWLSPILSPNRPPYIGSWNATAMFMSALFAQPSLAATLVTRDVMLPPGGPIHKALSLLHQVNVIAKPPEGSELDDAPVESGSIYANTGLIEDVLIGTADTSMLDIHSGLSMLGTRLPQSNNWF
ncbi:hypothetical protein [Martelella radicis]|uniref:Uncharacterized protein n=1 Tax=Martelella radicis TaxID=1397476 RepID=A0A7W6KNP3_9HYPH|nr:hypothetical protein [Martelella radicis]MBB4124641.1 hypothetical protein [Martelella radicis]